MTISGTEMAKATLSFPDGTVAHFEGNPEEVARLVSACTGARAPGATVVTLKKKGKAAPRKQPISRAEPEAAKPSVDIATICNIAKTCDDAEAIEEHILDQPSRINRVLLPLYLVHKHFDRSLALTTGDIASVTAELRVPVHLSNVSTTISGAASKYVMGDRVRRKGQPVRYKLNRRGIVLIEGTIRPKA